MINDAPPRPIGTTGKSVDAPEGVSMDNSRVPDAMQRAPGDARQNLQAHKALKWCNGLSLAGMFLLSLSGPRRT
jgi:hypothetical protein